MSIVLRLDVSCLLPEMQTICRYFGENIDDNNPDTVKGYCNNMCDVRLDLLGPIPF